MAAATTSVGTLITQSGYTGTVGDDITTDTVVATLQTPDGKTGEALRSWVRAARAKLGQPTDDYSVTYAFSANADLDEQTATAHGGAEEETSGQLACTAGFPVSKPLAGGGRRDGEMTAGHCLSALGYETPSGMTYPMVWQDASVGPYGDFEWLTTPQQAVTDSFYYGNTSLRKVTGLRTEFYKGQPYCFFGRSGGFRCSKVRYP